MEGAPADAWWKEAAPLGLRNVCIEYESQSESGGTNTARYLSYGNRSVLPGASRVWVPVFSALRPSATRQRIAGTWDYAFAACMFTPRRINIAWMLIAGKSINLSLLSCKLIRFRWIPSRGTCGSCRAPGRPLSAALRWS